MLVLPPYFDHKPFDKLRNKKKQDFDYLTKNWHVRLNAQLSLISFYFRAVNIMFCIYFYLILRIVLTIYKEQILRFRIAK